VAFVVSKTDNPYLSVSVSVICQNNALAYCLRNLVVELGKVAWHSALRYSVRFVSDGV